MKIAAIIGIMLVAAAYLLVFCMSWISAIGSRPQDSNFKPESRVNYDGR